MAKVKIRICLQTQACRVGVPGFGDVSLDRAQTSAEGCFRMDRVAEVGELAVNDSPAGDVVVGCGEAVMIGLSVVATALTAHRRATSCFVRRVTADTQRATAAGRHQLGDSSSWVQSKQGQEQ
jgi:hypothetical protein